MKFAFYNGYQCNKLTRSVLKNLRYFNSLRSFFLDSSVHRMNKIGSEVDTFCPFFVGLDRTA